MIALPDGARAFALVLAAVVLVSGSADAADQEDRRHRTAIVDWVDANRDEILEEFRGFLAIPNVSSDLEGIGRNAAHLRSMLERRGLEVRTLKASGSPYVFARLAPEGTHSGERAVRVLFYCHFDGQPVDPARWTVTEPFTPFLRGDPADPDARLFARSAADDKAPIVGLLAAIDALRAAGLPPNVDARFLFDPEEEIGSPNVAAVLESHRDLLRADLMIFADGPVHQSGRPTVVFGTRGIVTATVTVYGADRALHSGHYGNWAPNPAEKLASLLASLKDAEGRVLVEGFYDDVTPLSPTERLAIDAIPQVEADLMDEFLLARVDGGGLGLQELINLPSLNIRGLASAWVGAEARTIVPSRAVAEIDMRLVKDVAPARQVERLVDHIARQGFHVVREAPDDETLRRNANVVWVESHGGVPATRTPMDSPISRSLIEAVRRAVTGDPVLMPTLGGTGPLAPFEQGLGLPVYGVPIVNADNNQHAPDENLRLGNLWEGIVIYASLLRFPAIEE